MTIRPATEEDVPQVLPMVSKTASFHQNLDPQKYPFKENPAEMYRDWLTRQAGYEQSVFLVADAAAGRESPRVAGFIIGTVEPEIRIYRLTEYGFIHDLWVDENYRHEGLGQQLVMRAIERFTEIGVQQVRLDVLMKNEPARGLFEACGFRASIIEMLVETGE